MRLAFADVAYGWDFRDDLRREKGIFTFHFHRGIPCHILENRVTLILVLRQKKLGPRISGEHIKNRLSPDPPYKWAREKCIIKSNDVKDTIVGSIIYTFRPRISSSKSLTYLFLSWSKRLLPHLDEEFESCP